MKDVLSLYIHVPFCRYLCNYCDFFKYELGRDGSPSWDEFEASLLKQWKVLTSLYPREEKSENSVEKEMETIYFGGGTPSLWGERGIEFMASFLEKNNLSTKTCQWTLEVDPGTCTKSELKEWNSLGVNRFSVGLQTLDSHYLKIADRVHSLKEGLELLENLNDLGLDFSADFLLGLPHGRRRNIEEELDQIMAYKPSHLSLYMLTVPPGYLHYQALPKDDDLAREYLFVSEYLRGQGYVHYEVSNFARQGHMSKHNFVYWAGKSYWGLGPSATGQFRLGEESMERYRWNVKGDRIVEKLGKKELRLESLYLSLRTCNGFSSNLIPQNTLESWLSQGLVKRDSDRYKLSPEGFLIVDSMVASIL